MMFVAGTTEATFHFVPVTDAGERREWLERDSAETRGTLILCL